MSSLFCLLQVARQLQPSVVYIGDAERTFVKKVPKTDKVTFNSFSHFMTYVATCTLWMRNQTFAMGGKNRRVVKVNCRWQKTCSRQPAQSAGKVEPLSPSVVGTLSAGKHKKLPSVAKKKRQVNKTMFFLLFIDRPQETEEGPAEDFENS